MKNLTPVAIVLTCLLTACTKHNVLPFPKNYMTQMGGSRNWHGTISGVITHQIDTNRWTYEPYTDTIAQTFSASVNTDLLTVTTPILGISGTIGGEFLYSAYDTVHACLKFNSHYFIQLAYYYERDSIVMSGTSSGHNGSENVLLSTP